MTNLPPAPQQGQRPTGLTILKSMLASPSVEQQFKNCLNDNAPAFTASIIDLYNSDSNMQLCEPKAVIMEALKAATLKLPIVKALGYAFVIPYSNSVKNADGSWSKVATPTFQMGYKGYIQLAQRTGQYETINADCVYEGELRKACKLTGEIDLDGEKTSNTIIGYFAYIKLKTGFAKTLYMTVEQMANHAKRFSKGLDKDTTVDKLIALANIPIATEKAVGWKGNFHGMALKTVIRLLLSKYGYLSIEMQQAVTNDDTADVVDTETGEVIAKGGTPTVVDLKDTEYMEVKDAQKPVEPEAKPADDGPGF